MTELIQGTAFTNTKEGREAFRQHVLTKERERVHRNLLRERGNYALDIDAASALLDTIDATIVHDIDSQEEHDGSLSTLLTKAHGAVSDARTSGMMGKALPDTLKLLQDEIDWVNDLFEQHMKSLKAVIRNLTTGEPE